MVTKKALDRNGLKEMKEYFDVIINDITNANFVDVKLHFNYLSREQRIDFLSYLTDSLNDSTSDKHKIELIYKTLKYCIKLIY